MIEKVLIKIKEDSTLNVLYPNGDQIEFTNILDWETQDMIETMMHIGAKCKENGWFIEFENIV